MINGYNLLIMFGFFYSQNQDNVRSIISIEKWEKDSGSKNQMIVNLKKFFAGSIFSTVKKVFSKVNIPFPGCYSEGKLFLIINNELYCINLEKKKIIRYNTVLFDNEVIAGGMNFYNDILYIATSEGYVLGIDMKNNSGKKVKHGRMFLSAPTIDNKNIYIVDMADSLIEYNLNLENKREISPTKNSNYSDILAVAPIIYPEKVVYTNSLGDIVITNRKNLNSKTLEIKSKVFHSFKNLLKIPGSLLCISDSEILSIDMNKDLDLWKINIGTFTKPTICDNNFVISQENKVFFFDFKGDVQKIAILDNTLCSPHTIKINGENFIGILDINGNFYLIDPRINKYVLSKTKIDFIGDPYFVEFKKSSYVVYIGKKGYIGVLNIIPNLNY